MERQTLKVYGPNLALGEVDSDSSDGGDEDEDEDDDEQEEQQENPNEKVNAKTNPVTARQKRSPSVLVISDSEDSPNKKRKV